VTGFRVSYSARVTAIGFLSIDELVLESPEGDVANRVVVRHPGAVVVVPVVTGNRDGNDEHHALLVRQFRVATGGELLEVPAGKRDVDGEEPRTTAARELAEEIGFAPGRLVKLAEFFNTPGFCDEYSHLYAALDLVEADGPAPTSLEEKHMMVEQIALADVETLVAQRRLVDAKSIIGLLLARQYLAGAYPGIAE
jgi:8-oxo-dGTP pyrophosphatase MutT (NUDIX family)